MIEIIAKYKCNPKRDGNAFYLCFHIFNVMLYFVLTAIQSDITLHSSVSITKCGSKLISVSFG